MSIITENIFGTALVESLIEQEGYTPGNAADYGKERGMFKYEVRKRSIGQPFGFPVFWQRRNKSKGRPRDAIVDDKFHCIRAD